MSIKECKWLGDWKTGGRWGAILWNNTDIHSVIWAWGSSLNIRPVFCCVLYWTDDLFWWSGCFCVWWILSSQGLTHAHVKTVGSSFFMNMEFSSRRRSWRLCDKLIYSFVALLHTSKTHVRAVNSNSVGISHCFLSWWQMNTGIRDNGFYSTHLLVNQVV